MCNYSTVILGRLSPVSLTVSWAWIQHLVSYCWYVIIVNVNSEGGNFYRLYIYY